MITLGTAFAVSGAAIALGIAGVSTAIGCGSAGVSGAGAVAEDKENFRNALVLQAMPQTQTIYALIIALFIMIGAGLLGGGSGEGLTTAEGLVMLGAGIVMGLTGISAIGQGSVAGAGVAACSKNKDAFVPSIIFSGQCETPAIFGFIISVITLVIGLAIF